MQDALVVCRFRPVGPLIALARPGALCCAGTVRDSLAPTVDPNATELSPKDVPQISLRVRLLVFATAWATVLWFSIAPWFSQLHVRGVRSNRRAHARSLVARLVAFRSRNARAQIACGLTLLPFQVYWIYLMLWVVRWCWSGVSLCREQFELAMKDLRESPNGHRRFVFCFCFVF